MHAARSTLALALCCSVLMSPLTARAQLFGESEESKALRAQSARIAALQTRLEAMDARIDRIESAIRGQLQLQLRADQLTQELARLRGTIEEQANELANTQRKQIELQSTLDSRVRRLEPVTVEIDGRKASVEPAERRRFEAASALFAAKDYRNAQLSLAGFIADYPDSPYLPQAFVELGASQFLQKEYKAASDNLLTMVARFPDSPRLPEALLTLGSAQTELGDRRAARRTLELLLSRFPDSPVSGAAQERLKTLPAAR
ncbi:MAG: tol-pal system protein YbgF [Pseudomonadota bacterium]|jgi:tol-pal system protein YbgF